LEPVLPSEEEFPYTIRVVSEILSSNGSTSMGSVCGSTLSLMDAGVPIKSPIAGIAMGLIISDDSNNYAVLTDIQGIEDFQGDMDFKVAGSRDGITALQMDVKVQGINFDIMKDALSKAKDARCRILDAMLEVIDSPRADMNPYAPRMIKITIPSDKIGTVIGPGGKTIRGMIQDYNVSIDVSDDGSVIVGSADQSSADAAIFAIQSLVKEIEVGEIYTGKVTRIMNFGAFVEVLPGKEGLVHISQLATHRVENVTDEVDVGDEITVLVKEIDQQGRVNLSRKAVYADDSADDSESSEKNERNNNRRDRSDNRKRF
jgi:polyribonucleotide nucleotidyltransferase